MRELNVVKVCSDHGENVGFEKSREVTCITAVLKARKDNENFLFEYLGE